MPLRGELWWADFDPVVGAELGKKIRPVLVVSDDQMNRSVLRKVIVVPSTSSERELGARVPFPHLVRGQVRRSFLCCEDVRSISLSRLRGHLGGPTGRAPRVSASVLAQVEQALCRVLALPMPPPRGAIPGR